MDARGAQRLLEKIQGLAETAEQIGSRYVETMQREPRLSDAAKAKLTRLYVEHARRLTDVYAALGLEICDAVKDEAEDDQARGQLELFRANFETLRQRATVKQDEPSEDTRK
jgi:hypothetical protein